MEQANHDLDRQRRLEDQTRHTSEQRHFVKAEYKYSGLTGQIIKCAMNVHNELGNGFQEVIYQRAMELELRDSGVEFQREFEMPIYYKGTPIGSRRVDFLINEKISVEFKALIAIDDVHLAQAINYLEAYKLEVGLLINFGARKLEFKRVLNKKLER
jgi:GxxExxY protein